MPDPRLSPIRVAAAAAVTRTLRALTVEEAGSDTAALRIADAVLHEALPLAEAERLFDRDQPEQGAVDWQLYNAMHKRAANGEDKALHLADILDQVRAFNLLTIQHSGRVQAREHARDILDLIDRQLGDKATTGPGSLQVRRTEPVQEIAAETTTFHRLLGWFRATGTAVSGQIRAAGTALSGEIGNLAALPLVRDDTLPQGVIDLRPRRRELCLLTTPERPDQPCLLPFGHPTTTDHRDDQGRTWPWHPDALTYAAPEPTHA